MESGNNGKLGPSFGNGTTGDVLSRLATYELAQAEFVDAVRRHGKDPKHGSWQIWELSPRRTHAAKVKQSRQRWLLGVFLKG
jgi:hypothetical protein